MTNTKLRLLAALSLMAAIALVAGATYLGYWLGGRQGGQLDPIVMSDLPELEAPSSDEPMPPASTEPPVVQAPAPLFIAPVPGAEPGGGAALAAEAAPLGLRSYVLQLELPWGGDASGLEAVLAEVAAIRAADADARFLFDVSLNPPAAWLEEHGAAIDETALPEPASEAWQDAATGALTLTTERLTAGAPRAVGLILRAFDDGLWRLPEAYRDTEACQAAFRLWLAEAYASDDALSEAWGRETRTEEAAVPSLKEGEEGPLLSGEGAPALADFRRFLDETAADAADHFAAELRERSGGALRALLPIDADAPPGTGALTLALALEGPADGIVLRATPGLGTEPVFSAAIDSAAPRGKACLLALDRASVEEAEESAVLARTYGAALTHGAGLIWYGVDAGALEGGPRRELLERMTAGYLTARPMKAAPEEAVRALGPWKGPTHTASLCVVSDQASQRYFRSGSVAREVVSSACEAASRSGFSTRYALLDDVIRGRVRARTYLFPDLVALNGAERAALHDRLASQEAAAIWLYAPGGAQTEAVTSATGMTVSAFDETPASGSSYAISGRWLNEGDSFEGTLRPLFYVEDDADVIARYAGSERVSAAMKVLDAGWTSIIIGESAVPAELLAELLLVLDEHAYVRETPATPADPMQTGPGVLSVFAMEAGARRLDFGRPYRATDLLEPATGWPRNETVTAGFTEHQTRVFHLSQPAEAAAAD